jgi:isocitrate dehydrogenase
MTMMRRAKVAKTLTSRLASRGMATQPKIVWTYTDEAPALATFALLPVVQRFAGPAGLAVELSDISVAGRIIAGFPERLTDAQRQPDELAQLGELAKTPDANIVKLPNVSASIPQLQSAIAELQSKGYDLPDFPASPSTAEEKEIAAKYAKVLGSAVNPVLREGNSDRRVAAPVKAYAQKRPHKLGKWEAGSKTHVAHMTDGDFFSSELSHTMANAGSVRIELLPSDGGSAQVLKPETKLEAGEVIDSSRMSVAALNAFFEASLQKANSLDLMVSLHLKATMMKVSDPIMFGHAVTTYFTDAFAAHGDALKAAGANPNNGLGAVYDSISTMASPQKETIQAAFAKCMETRPPLAYVDSHKGITNLHVPSDVIIDASMPNVIRDSGKMWNKDDALEDTMAIIPDRCYATMYQAVVDDCKANGQFDVTTMGNISNVGLMAQKAEEYGSHDKTFEVKTPGTIQVVDNASGAVYFTHAVETGDIWRMCQTKDAPIRDWVRLAVSRARATGSEAIFWLDESRAHDKSLIGKVNEYMKEHDTTGLAISIKKPVDAINASMANARARKDTISVTGNVLRDYLTDLFPILELGTSAKMLSIVPLLAGGGLFETGAGGSAPKHVQQFVKEGHLRWDSLGEYLALAVSLEDHAAKTGNERAKLLAQTLNEATGKLLDEDKSPSRKVNQLDNRGSTFYIARYWAEAMAKHDASFATLSTELIANEEKIVAELIECQGEPVDLGGYWKPEPAKVDKAMRASPTFNKILDA